MVEASTVEEKAATNPAEFVYLNRETGKLVFDRIAAIQSGLDSQDAERYAHNVESLASAQVLELITLLGANVEDLTAHRESGVTTYALPAILVPVLAVVGTAAADAIIQAVVNWGLSGACSALQGKFGPFDSFCRANGWQ